VDEAEIAFQFSFISFQLSCSRVAVALRRWTKSLKEVTRCDIEANKRDLEAIRLEFKLQLEAVEAQTAHWGDASSETGTATVNPLWFDGSISWTMFRPEFEAVIYHNGWSARMKDMHLLAILQGQAVDILCSVPAITTYEDTVGTLKGDYEIMSWWSPTSHNLQPEASWASTRLRIRKGYRTVGLLLSCLATRGLHQEGGGLCISW
jgi:hypothetical protein